MSDSETPEEQEPKIIVDDDWKEQVAKEKEAAAAEPKPEPEAEPEPKPEPESDAVTDQATSPAPPPASFDVLVTMLFTQAMSTLGQFPGPDGKTEVNKPFAKHFINTMEMLEEKTKGNLTEDESKGLGEALHALRMAYVNTKG